MLQAGATAVVPETLEPSLQLASAVLSQLNMPSDEVAQAIQNFRKNHVAELQVCFTATVRATTVFVRKAAVLEGLVWGAGSVQNERFHARIRLPND